MATSHYCHGKWRDGPVAACPKHKQLGKKQSPVVANPEHRGGATGGKPATPAVSKPASSESSSGSSPAGSPSKSSSSSSSSSSGSSES